MSFEDERVDTRLVHTDGQIVGQVEVGDSSRVEGVTKAIGGALDQNIFANVGQALRADELQQAQSNLDSTPWFRALKRRRLRRQVSDFISDAMRTAILGALDQTVFLEVTQTPIDDQAASEE